MVVVGCERKNNGKVKEKKKKDKIVVITLVDYIES